MTPEQATAVLVQRQLLTETARRQLLDAAAPGDLIAHCVEASPADADQILHALASAAAGQAPRIRLAQVNHQPAALEYLSAREAWEYLILPLEIEADGTLLCCTTRETLPTSLGHLYRKIAGAFRIVLADIGPLEMYIAEQYRYEGIDIEAEAA